LGGEKMIVEGKFENGEVILKMEKWVRAGVFDFFLSFSFSNII
jgi:hypothetical protein